MSIKKILVSAMLLSAMMSGFALAQEAESADVSAEIQAVPVEAADVAEPAQETPVAPAAAEEELDPNSAAAQLAALDKVVPPPKNIPAVSYWGTRGLSQTSSAEPLGAGRLNVALGGGYFQIDKTEPHEVNGVPNYGKGANVAMMRAAVAYGANDNLDIFGYVPFNIIDYKDDMSFVVGQLAGGALLSFPPLNLGSVPVRFGAMGILSYPFNNEDGIITANYRTDKGDNTDNTVGGYDFMGAPREKSGFNVTGKFLGTIPILHDGIHGMRGMHALRFIGNAGLSYEIGSGDFNKNMLVLLAAGLQYDPIPDVSVGLEFNSRTTMRRLSPMADPFWMTVSGGYNSPYNFGVLGGVDISLTSSKNSRGYRQLEPWRAFGDLVISFDTHASKREEAARQQRAELEARARAEREAQLRSVQLSDLEQKRIADSIRAAQELAQQREADSLRAKAIADSLAQREAQLRAEAEQTRAQLIAEAEQIKAEAEQTREQMLAAAEQKRIADSIALATAAQQREAELLAEAAQRRAADSAALAATQQQLEQERAKRSEAEQFLLDKGMLILDNVYFTSGRAEIQRNSLPYLRTIAQMLVKYPALKIEIGGHSDNVGNPNTNLRLSQQRADAVFNFLVRTEPALAQMLSAKGYGSSMPKEDNRTAAGREANRRVELKVLNPDAIKTYNP